MTVREILRMKDDEVAAFLLPIFVRYVKDQEEGFVGTVEVMNRLLKMATERGLIEPTKDQDDKDVLVNRLRDVLRKGEIGDS